MGGFAPEGIHAAPWQQTRDGWTLRISWQTGDAKLGGSASPPQPYNPRQVAATVRYDFAPGVLNLSTTGNSSLVYSCKYDKGCGGSTYQSPIIHHVLVRALPPSATVHYSVGEANCGSDNAKHVVRSCK